MNINYWVDYADQHDGELIHELDRVSGLDRYWLVLPNDDNEKELLSDSTGLNWYLAGISKNHWTSNVDKNGNPIIHVNGKPLTIYCGDPAT